MSYVGNSPTQQSFTGGVDQYNGNNSNTAFGLTRSVNTVYDVDVYVENVWQRPTTGYTVSANTITFTSAPPSGSNNVVVVYKNFTATSVIPQQGSVVASSLSANLIPSVISGSALSGITTLASGNTTITGTANVSQGLTANTLTISTNTASIGTSVVSAQNGNFYHYPAAGGRMQIGDFANSSNYHELWVQGSDDLVSTGVQVVRRSVVAGGSYAGNNFLRMTGGGLVYGTDGFKLISYDTVSGYNNRVVVDTSGNITSFGGQLKFPATQSASSDANTLDDYEEGTWTPVITNLTNSVSAYYWQSGVYRKIGNMVWIEAQLSVQTVGSVTGNVYITGLPFSLAQKSGLGTQTKTIVYGTKYAGSAQGAIAMIIESSAPTQFQAFFASDISSWIQGSTLTPGGQWHFQGCYVATA